MFFGVVASGMMVGSIYAPDCALFAVPNLWTVMNTFCSFIIEGISEVVQYIINNLKERINRMDTNKNNSGERQELNRKNFSNMNEKVLLKS